MTTVSTTFCFLSGIKNSIQLFTVSITVGVILNNGDKHLLFFFFSSFDCAGSLVLCRLFSSCGEWGLLSSCGAQAIVVAFLVADMGSRVCGLQ